MASCSTATRIRCRAACASASARQKKELPSGIRTLAGNPGRILEIEPQRPVRGLLDADPGTGHDVPTPRPCSLDNPEHAPLERDTVQRAGDAQRFAQARGAGTERFLAAT